MSCICVCIFVCIYIYMCVRIYIYIYIYIYMGSLAQYSVASAPPSASGVRAPSSMNHRSAHTFNLHTKILDFRGFD